MTLLYIIGLIIIFIFITIATEIEWFGWSTFTLIGSVIAAHFLHVLDILPYVKTHILYSIIYSISYMVIGISWSFPKWFFFLRNERDKTREWLKTQYIVSYESYDPPGIKYKNTYETLNPPVINIPQASFHKGKIIAWCAYWPFSLIGTLLNDPARKAFNIIFDQFKNLYQKMADSIFKDDIDKLNNQIQFARRTKATLADNNDI